MISCPRCSALASRVVEIDRDRKRVTLECPVCRERWSEAYAPVAETQ